MAETEAKMAETEAEVVGENQWVVLTIAPLGFTLGIRNAQLKWGKFHEHRRPSREIPPGVINQIVITSGNRGIIASSGRQGAASGTEGQFDVFDGLTTHVGTYYWNCPYGSDTNSSVWTPRNDNYVTQVTGANLGPGGPLGNIQIKCAKVC